MRKLFIGPFAALASLALLTAGCTGYLSEPSSPPPLEQTTVDEKALVLALETFDTTLTSVDILVDAGYIEPGSEQALEIARYIDSAKGWLQAASSAQRAGSASSYLEAIENARAAIARVKAALSKENSS